MSVSTLADDLFALASSASVAFMLRHILAHFFAEVIPDWKRLAQTTKQRLTVEMATIPARIAVGSVIFPIVLTSFTSIEKWQSEDTNICLLVW